MCRHSVLVRLVYSCAFSLFISTVLVGQQPLPIGGGQGPGNQGNGGASLFGGGNGQGGSAQADFDSLIDLIVSTVESNSWTENGTGEGEISPFDINGVYADAKGTLKFKAPSKSLDRILQDSQATKVPQQNDVRRSSELRFISLPRLEATIREHQTNHQPLPPEVLTLAGLERIEYVIVAPQTGDLILAGQAGDWLSQPDGILVSSTSGRAVVRLDDLLTLWRRHQARNAKAFGCSIIPRQAALAKTQAYVNSTASTPIEPSQRRHWLDTLRDNLGEQDVEFFGIHPDSHAAQVLLVADYHMKLIGMGIADGVDGVRSYLSTVRLRPDGSAPPMSVLRWWFAMNYKPVEVSDERNVFRLRGQGVQVLSENELLAARGKRVHTGQSDALNRQFAESFTEHFPAILEQYPLYGELQNIFDIALVLSMIEQEGILERIGWEPTLFLNSAALRLPKTNVPQTVQTVINHRVIARQHIIAGISGGVWVDASKSLAVRTSDSGATAKRGPLVDQTKPEEQDTWWWDAPTTP